MRFPEPTAEMRARDAQISEMAKAAQERWAKMTPLERAIASAETRRGYVAAEMTLDNQDNVIRTKEEALAIFDASEDGIILAELKRLQAASTAHTARQLELKEELKSAFVAGCSAALSWCNAGMPTDDLNEAGYDYASQAIAARI